MVVTGTPSVTLEFADSNITGAASYEDTGGATILFSYTVDDGDRATDGIEIKAGSLTDGTGSIQSTDGTDANLTHNRVSLAPIYYVDGVLPTYSSASVSEDGTTVTVNFTENVRMRRLLASLIEDNTLPVETHDFILSVLTVEVDGAWTEQRATCQCG